MPDYVKFPLVMLIVTCISATALSYISLITEPRIEEQERRKEQAAVAAVFPGADRTERKEVELSEAGRRVTYQEVYRGGALAGYAITGAAPGYSSTIEVLAGVRPDLTVQGVKVLSQQETPGLGTRIDEVESTATWLGILSGKESLVPEGDGEEPVPWFIRTRFVEDEQDAPRRLRLEDLRLTADGGKVEAITGATISSRAVTEAVRQAVADLTAALGDGP
jgi:RnfABCDGE-type electron transport complex G subunit